MKLDLSQIKSVALGSVRVTQEEDGFHFYRFTQAQEALYKDRSDDFYMKSFATSGVQLRFNTNSEKLFMKVCLHYQNKYKTVGLHLIIFIQMVHLIKRLKQYLKTSLKISLMQVETQEDGL